MSQHRRVLTPQEATIEARASLSEPGPTFSPSARMLGIGSAVLATIFSFAYDVGQLAEWGGMLGSGGGPENASTPLGLVVLLTPSLFLGSAFLLLLVGVHQLAPLDRKVRSQAALVFGTAYTVLISINYFVQLTLVAPRLARGHVQGIEPFLFVPFDSFLYAIDILGYSFMSVATLLAARVFTGAGLNRVARWFRSRATRLSRRAASTSSVVRYVGYQNRSLGFGPHSEDHILGTQRGAIALQVGEAIAVFGAVARDDPPGRSAARITPAGDVAVIDARIRHEGLGLG